MKYDPELHHRRSIRLRDYDYANAGAYFVTACCQNRINYFGDIENDKMILNEYGNIAHNELAKTPEIRPNVELFEFVVMPNHIHAIIRVTEYMGETTIGSIIRGYKSAVSKQIRECVGVCNGKEEGVCNTPYVCPNRRRCIRQKCSAMCQYGNAIIGNTLSATKQNTRKSQNIYAITPFCGAKNV